MITTRSPIPPSALPSSPFCAYDDDRCCDPRDGNGLWFNEDYTTEQFEYAWVMMAQRYNKQLYVVGTDLRNEIRPDLKVSGQFSWNSYPKVSIKVPVWGLGDRVVQLKEIAPEFASYSHPDLLDIRHKALLFFFKQVVSRTQVETYDWHTVATRVTNKVGDCVSNWMGVV